jgi:hypothetical protein
MRWADPLSSSGGEGRGEEATTGTHLGYKAGTDMGSTFARSRERNPGFLFSAKVTTKT